MGCSTADPLAGLVKRSFSLTGHRTSVALEAEFWAVLADIAAKNQHPLSALIADIDATRSPDSPLASALRVYALQAALEGDRLKPMGRLA